MALVLVLAALALISFLVLVILTMARTEDRTSTAAAEISDVRTLADMPAQLVISQIRRATSELGVSYTWASQPGMIRVFPSEGTAIPGTARVKALECYKLYSSSRMTVDGESFDPAKEAQSFQNWESAPALYTDLNQAVMKTPVRTATNTSNKAGEEPKFIYPILDPSAVNSVEGFEITGTPPGSDTAKKRPLPMPALWLYVLKDGRVVAPTSGSGPNASFSSGPTKDNPIVGRIAFWTDDEGCKLNLNTASEPAPWDTPRTNSKQDHLYAERQPARNEFHRQSGHPAYTALSPVFKSFSGKTAGSGTANTIFTPRPDPTGQPGDDTAFNDYINAVHHLLPRTVTTEAGSYNGTVKDKPTDAAVTKRQRLYTTVDELLFSTDLDSEQRRLPNSSGPSGTGYQVTEEDVRKARFFLTTRSSSPETTPFNRPKISLWTVQSDPAEQTDLDRAMMFAASTEGAGGQRVPYFFQRAKSWKSESDPGSSQSPYADARVEPNMAVLGFLRSFVSSPVPGYANASFVTKYASRNPDRPGDADVDRLLISMFDMLRWGVNPGNFDSDSNRRYTYAPQIGENGSASLGDGGANSAAPAVLPRADGEAVKGFGRFPTITEMALVFVATDAERQGNGFTDSNPPDQMADKTKKVRMFIVLEPFVAALGSPSAAPCVAYRIRGLEQWRVREPGGSEHALFPERYADTNQSWNVLGKPSVLILDVGTALNGLSAQFLQKDGSPKDLPPVPPATPPDAQSVFPFVSNEIVFQQPAPQDGSLTLLATPVTVEISDPLNNLDQGENPVIQRIRIPFPETSNIPMPWLPTDAQADPSLRIRSRFELKVAQGSGEPWQELVQKGDVVRSVEMAPVFPENAGPDFRNRSMTDYRLLANAGAGARMNEDYPITFVDDPENLRDDVRVAPELFPPLMFLATAFSDPARVKHTLRSGHFTRGTQYGTGAADQQMLTSATAGARFLRAELAPPETSVPVLPQSAFPSPPNAPASLNVVTFDRRYGDFDNGPGQIEDGPYVSRFDFGTTANELFAAQSQVPPFGGYFQRGGYFQHDQTLVNLAPLRQISSAVAFGSLPSQVHTVPRPWTTLLFCPNPSSRMTSAQNSDAITGADHFGFGFPAQAGDPRSAIIPDHLWLEHFWMPVVEPRPLSSGFSTEGKVNMNYQIMPFTWIKRATAMHGALQGVRITAIPSTDTTKTAYDAGGHYKVPSTPGQVLDKQYRYIVNAKETLKGFDEQRFAKGDIFRTPSEICEMFLVPKRMDGHEYGSAANPASVKWSEMVAWWNGSTDPLAVDAFEATGDNTREAPYAQLYPRLCTRSNVYRVHFRVQLLKKSRATNPAEWDETKDQVAAEYRGSSVVERYLDPHDKAIPDMIGTINSSDALDDYFRYRVVEKRPFAP